MPPLHAPRRPCPPQTPVYWNWVGPSTVGIVTATHVYHWSSSYDGSAPVSMFERAANVAGTQIINYAASPDYKWLLLAGMKPASVPGGVAAEGALQLYSVENKMSEALVAHAGCFHITTRLPGRTDPALLFLFVEHKPGPGERPKLQIIEIGRERTAPGGVFRPAPMDFPVPTDDADDYAVTMQVRLEGGEGGGGFCATHKLWFQRHGPPVAPRRCPDRPSVPHTPAGGGPLPPLLRVFPSPPPHSHPGSPPRSSTWCTS
jgi:hypothetical protein